jgi:hypothetical protein
MDDIKSLPGMKLDELTKLGNCAVCGKKQLEGGIPLFYCVTITRGGFDGQALQRAHGLELQIGPLAAVMGPNEDLAKIFDGPTTVFVHETCADKVSHLAMLIPRGKEEAA